MAIFPKKPPVINPAEMVELESEIRNKMMEDRGFWDDLVRYQVGEDSRPADADRIVQLADLLLEIRKGKFPL